MHKPTVILPTNIPIKPLSVNEAWKGRRYKTKKYKNYIKAVGLLLPNNYKIPTKGKLSISFIFYFSNIASDYDNPIKPLQDIICDYYGINDNRFYEGHQIKVIVPKGQERTEFNIKPYIE